jgi:hypothetical protein
MKTIRRFAIIFFFLVAIVVVYVYLMKANAPEIEASRKADPSGEYCAVVTHKGWQVPNFSAPGDAGNHAGFIRIEDRSGRSFGKAPLPILWMADDLRWEPGGAHLVGIAHWDFAAGTCDVFGN